MTMLLTEVWMTPKQDAYVSEYYPNQNFGGQPYLFSNRFLQEGDRYRLYLKFDLLDVFTRRMLWNCEIKYACLKLPLFRNEMVEPGNIYAYRVLQDWKQEYITWNSQPVLALQANGRAHVCEGYLGIVDVDVTALVEWWQSGMYENFGVMITCNEKVNSLLGFFSTEYPNSDYWPRLKICFSDCCCK